jgi:hypothetical protein
MMRWDSFGRSAAFAACAALLWIPWLLVVGPVAGPWTARALYLVGATAAYVAGLGGRVARGLPAAVLAAGAGCVIAVVARDAATLSVGLAVVLAVARSAFLYRAAPARAVAIETVLAGGGLVFARLLGTRSALGMLLPIWGFFLVQSFFFLVGGVDVRRPASAHPDPFEAARARAMEILERGAL